MAVKPIPDGYHAVTPYLVVDDPQKLIDFLKEGFGAKTGFCMSMEDGKIAHAEVHIGDSPIMIGGAQPEQPATSAMLYLYVEDVDATFARAVKAGGTAVREPADQFYGDRSGGIKGPCGNQWWIATHVEDLTEEEIGRRAQEQGKPQNA